MQSLFDHILSLKKHLLMALLLWAAAAATAEQRQVFVDGRAFAPLEVFQECADCPEMIVLPMGSFMMGAPLEESAAVYLLLKRPKPGEPIGNQNEGPEHEVIIDIPIAMGRNEVTRAEWLACVEGGGCTHTPDPSILTLSGSVYADDPRSPVMDVSYLDVLE